MTLLRIYNHKITEVWDTTRNFTRTQIFKSLLSTGVICIINNVKHAVNIQALMQHATELQYASLFPAFCPIRS